MAPISGVVRTGFLTVLVAVAALGLGLALASTVQAQNPPFTAYGGGLTDGDSVEALIDGNSCGSTTVDSSGEWVLIINEGDCGGSAGGPTNTISFYLNGSAANETETWSAGGAPTDAVNGISLTAADGGGEVTPPDTGSAGIVSTSGGVASWLALALGAFALASVGVARTATRRAQ